MCIKSDIQEYGLSLTGFDEIKKSIWVTCPLSFIHYATHMRRLGTVYRTGVFHIYELSISDEFGFEYALSAIESDIDYWSEPENYRRLIDGLMFPDRTMIEPRGIWN